MQDQIAARFQEGLAHQQAERFAEAQEAFSEVLTADPGHAEAWRQMSLLAGRFGRPDLALDWIGKAVALEPGNFAYVFAQGVVLQQNGRFADAEAAYRQVIALNPRAPEAHNNLGIVLGKQNRRAESVAPAQRAVELVPNRAVFHENLGITFSELGRHDEAEACFRMALALDPDHVPARHNLGKSLHSQGRLEEAGGALQEALRRRQDDPRILNDMGVLLHELGRVADAEMVFRTALPLAPDDPDLHYNLSLILLLTGQYREGWAEYRWRWKTDGYRIRQRGFTQPEWDGSPLPGGRLLINAEQGLGDTLQFCRLAPLAAARLAPGARLTLEVHRPLVSLLRDQWPGIEVIGHGDPPPAFDAYLPLLSLPGVLEQDQQTIDGAPYLRSDPERTAAWAERLAPLEGLKVGLVWAGGQHIGGIDRKRSVTLAALAPLATVPGVSFVSLQKDAPAAQAKTPPAGMDLLDLADDLTDFVETAAVVANLDLVISVDTAVAHLAGALGTPVWLLNRFDTCWRWELERTDSPWYAGLRQFRQPTTGDWDSVVEALTAALAERARPISR